MLSRLRFLLPAVAGFLAVPAFADVNPHPIFTDNMVLQRDAEIPVWGLADAGEKVSVTLGEATATATADKDGRWKAKLPATKAAMKATFLIEGKNKIEFKNVAVGDIWVCSGQSNMSTPTRAATTSTVCRPGRRTRICGCSP